MNECILCGADFGLTEEEYFPGTYFCFDCLNSDAGMDWRDGKRKTDAGYARYCDLITIARNITCRSCEKDLELRPKGRGFEPAVWTLSCDRCARTIPLDDTTLLTELSELQTAFACNRDPEKIEERLKKLSLKIQPVPCACGSHHSLLAYPRCPYCHAVAVESPYHAVG